MCRRCEEGVPFPTAAALCDDCLLSALQDLHQDFPCRGIADDRSRRHGKDYVAPRMPRLVRAHPVFPTLGAPAIAIRVVEQGRKVAVAPNDYVAAAAAVAAIPPSNGNAMRAPGRRAARPASPGLDLADEPAQQ